MRSARRIRSVMCTIGPIFHSRDRIKQDNNAHVKQLTKCCSSRPFHPSLLLSYSRLAASITHCFCSSTIPTIKAYFSPICSTNHFCKCDTVGRDPISVGGTLTPKVFCFCNWVLRATAMTESTPKSDSAARASTSSGDESYRV